MTILTLPYGEPCHTEPASITPNSFSDACKHEIPAKQSKVETHESVAQLGQKHQLGVVQQESTAETVMMEGNTETPAKKSETEVTAPRRRSARLNKSVVLKTGRASPSVSSDPSCSSQKPSSSEINSSNSKTTPSKRDNTPSASAMPSTSNCTPSTSAHNEPEASQNDSLKSGDEVDKLTESDNLMDFTDSEPKSSTEQGESGATVDHNITQDCLGNGREEETESYPKVCNYESQEGTVCMFRSRYLSNS